jgi:pectate lyase
MRRGSKKYARILVGALVVLLLASIHGALSGASVRAAEANRSVSNAHMVSADVSTNLFPEPDPGRQVLPEKDGWASADGGTTGGAHATPDQVYTVTNRAQLVQALGGDNTGANATPKIIYIQGTINGNEDDSGNALTCDTYITGGYSLAAYLQTYDPAVWGRTTKPGGPQEDARHASERNQAKQIQIFLPSNTTIIGIGSGARVLGANFMISNVNNVIVRNIQFENAFDCFPQWDPTDGATGNWNSMFDNISILNNATHVWIDHDSFTDGSMPDSQEPLYFGREFEQHDGELDITKGADLVTVSWNRFTDHDKTMLIGSTDSPTFDVGKLRVTIHHNAFENTIQRLPRVRYGQVHVYNNYYNEGANPDVLYALGVGVSSQIFEQNDYYIVPSSFAVGDIIGYFKGTAIHTENDLVNGMPTNLLDAYNAINTPTLSGDVGWTPQFHLAINPTPAVPALVLLFAGSGRLLTLS